jgi:hypothetical protein
MTTAGTDLSVRRHERVLCDLEALVSVAPECQGAVKLSRGAGRADGAIAARVVDCSQGGLGLQTRVFLPGTCVLMVRFTQPGSGGEVRARVRVQRVTMQDRAPTYYIGTAFEDEDSRCDLALGRLIQDLLAQGRMAPAGVRRA